MTDIDCSSCGKHLNVVTADTISFQSELIQEWGRFQTVKCLGQGSFGTVWKAKDSKLDRVVALKIPHRESFTQEHADSFMREARAAAQLRHPRIVGVYEVGLHDGLPFIVAEYVDGVTLKDWLSGEPNLGPNDAARLVSEIAQALHHAHEQNVVHRDLKPSNILMDGNRSPHLTDFGLAKRASGEATLTAEGEVMGTAAYMSPEQAGGRSHTADRRSDVYALGVIMFELLTGERPFQGNLSRLLYDAVNTAPPRPRTIRRSIPKSLEAVCLKCMKKKPEQRYQSAEEVLCDIHSHLGLPMPESDSVKQFRHRRRRERFRKVAAITLGLFLVALIGVLVSKNLPMRGQVAVGENKGKTKSEKQKLPAKTVPKSVPVLAKVVPRRPPQRSHQSLTATPIGKPMNKEFITAGIPDCVVCHAARRNPETQLNIAALAEDGNAVADDGWCLLNEVNVWGSKGFHFTAFANLKSERAQQIGKRLGVVDAKGHSHIHRDMRCLACHSGLPLNELTPSEGERLISEQQSQEIRLNRGVACEICHGPAKEEESSVKTPWFFKHYTSTWRYTTAAKKASHGEYDLTSPITKTILCVSCHQGNVGAGKILTPEMLKAGHPPLPPFELTTYISQMPRHWRWLNEKSSAIQKAYLEKTKDHRKFDPSNYPVLRHMLVSAVVARAEQLRFSADLCDEQVRSPVDRPIWVEYAPLAFPQRPYFDLTQYDHYKDLANRPDSQLLLTQIAVRLVGESEAELEVLLQQAGAAMKLGLNGDMREMVEGLRKTERWLQQIALKIERMTLTEHHQSSVLRQIAEFGSTGSPSHDAGIRLVWAFDSLYTAKRAQAHASKLTKEDRERESKKLFFKNENLGDVIKTGVELKADDVELALALMNEILLLDLRRGRVKEISLGENVSLPVMEKDYGLFKKKRGEYAPADLISRFRRVQRALKE